MNFNLKFDGPIKHLDPDFVIVSLTGKEIPCHKFVLASKSPVFDAMFEMKESQEVLNSRIEILGVSDESLEAMVKFIYSGKIDDKPKKKKEKPKKKKCKKENSEKEDDPVDDVGDFCQDLLVLANKYNLKLLATAILPKVIQNIDVENCIEAYVFGILHEYEEMAIKAFNIIVFVWNFLQIKESKLKKLSKDFPKIYETLTNKIKTFDFRSSSKSDVFGMINCNNCVEAYILGIQQNNEIIKSAAFDHLKTNWEFLQLRDCLLWDLP